MQILFDRGEVSFLNDVRMVELVLGFFQEEASYVNSSGTLPLVLLLDEEYRNYNNNSWTLNSIVLTLMKAAPEALSTRNTTRDLHVTIHDSSMHS
jgi:hypothetical protein